MPHNFEVKSSTKTGARAWRRNSWSWLTATYLKSAKRVDYAAILIEGRAGSSQLLQQSLKVPDGVENGSGEGNGSQRHRNVEQLHAFVFDQESI